MPGHMAWGIRVDVRTAHIHSPCAAAEMTSPGDGNHVSAPWARIRGMPAFAVAWPAPACLPAPCGGCRGACVPVRACTCDPGQSRRFPRGHNYIGHTCIDHDSIGHNCMGHNYIAIIVSAMTLWAITTWAIIVLRTGSGQPRQSPRAGGSE